MYFLTIFLGILPIALSQSWFPFGSEYEYFVGTGNVDYNSSQTACRNMSSELAIVNSSQLENFISDLFNRTEFADNYASYWIGLTRQTSSNNAFEWIDGSPLTHRNWNEEKETRDTNENCVVTAGQSRGLSPIQFKWFTVPCDGSFTFSFNRGYICQRTRDISSSITVPSTVAATSRTGNFTSSSNAITAPSTATTTSTELSSTSYPTSQDSIIATRPRPSSSSTTLTSGSATKIISISQTILTTITSSSHPADDAALAEESLITIGLQIILPIVAVMFLIICLLVFYIVYKKRTRSMAKLEQEKLDELNARPTLKIEKDDISLPYMSEGGNSPEPEIEASIYHSTTSLEMVEEREKPVLRKPLYSQVNKPNKTDGRMSVELTDEDEDAFYTTIKEQKEEEEDPTDPYITFEEMASLNDSTYSLRQSVHDANGLIQPTSDLYDALDQSR